MIYCINKMKISLHVVCFSYFAVNINVGRMLEYLILRDIPGVFISWVILSWTVEKMLILALAIARSVLSVVTMTSLAIGIYLLKQPNSYQKNQIFYLISVSVLELFGFIG